MGKSLTTNILDAKTRFSQLVDLVESRSVDEVIIARNGRPAAKLVRLDDRPPVRLGVARGKFSLPPSIDGANDEIRSLFENCDDAISD